MPRSVTGARSRTGAVPAGAPYEPVAVVDMDLARPYEFRAPGGDGPIHPRGPVLALVRLRGHPLGLLAASGDPARRAGPSALWRCMADTARRRFATPLALSPALGEQAGPPRADCRATCPLAPPDLASHDDRGTRATRSPHPRGRSAPRPACPPPVSVIVATHNRPDMLRQCLNSLLRLDYPSFEVIVVDNAPTDDAAERLVLDQYKGRVRYLREPVAGLAHAHNRGLANARGSIAAFTDDDTLVDSRWLSAIAESFAQGPGVSCVTGLIVPAELRTEAQAALEHHGGFAKGFTPRRWSLHERQDDPLFPFTAGRFGSGANMAFRVASLRALGGFDPATGTGTPAHGGDDLLAFFRVLAAGDTLAYQPDAVVWHRHRRTPDAVDAQAFGYGAGLGAYLTGALIHEPRMIPGLLVRLPRGIRYALRRARDHGSAGTEGSRRRALLELRGLLYGPYGYLRGRRLYRAGSGRA
ncbi:glycosyltransferase [Streptomyces sp. NPDC018693]|uniref:glycosyltransferase n=1 Tax=unclassified Streptomyces TaxID=2593676 RepID=UPI0037B94153